MGWLSPRKSGDESKASLEVVPALTGAAPVPEPFPLPGSPFSTNSETAASLSGSAGVDAVGPALATDADADETTPAANGSDPVPNPGSLDGVDIRDAGIYDRLDELSSEQASLRELFHARLRNDEVQNRSLDRLLTELSDYKADFVRRRMLPLLREVIDCHDLAHRESRRLRTANGASPETEGARKSLEVVAQMLRDLLARHDVESYESEGPEFDPKSQQCTRTVPTEDRELDKRVAESIVPGFRSEGMLVRRELVAVYRHVPPGEAPTNSPVP
jgi:molecular chaperone GrpE (heat shock protein)